MKLPVQCLFLGIVLAAPALPGQAAEALPPVSSPLYTTPRVLRLRIEIPPAGLESLRAEPRTYVKATVREADQAYPNAGLRLRGGGGAPLLESKPNLTIKFDEFDAAQVFHGHDRIVLNNALNDPSYLREAIAGEIFRAAGVPAVRVTFARVELNGRDAGLYVLAQAPNRDFLSDHFKRTKGNFYEGNRNDVTDKLRLDSGGGPKDQSDLRALANAAQERDRAQRMQKLAAVLDLERFIAFLAAELFTWNRDGYSLNRDNYRLYNDPLTGRLIFLPDGLEEVFGLANGPLLPECKGLVSRAVLDTPEGQRLYRERLGVLLAGPCRTEALHKHIQELASILRPALAAEANAVRAFDSAVTQLRETIGQRVKFLQDELKQPAP